MPHGAPCHRYRNPDATDINRLFPETAVHAVPSTEMVQISKDWLSPRDVLEMCNSRSIHYETCQVDTL